MPKATVYSAECILPADPRVREVGSARMAEQGRREGVTWLRGKPYISWQVPHKPCPIEARDPRLTRALYPRLEGS